MARPRTKPLESAEALKAAEDKRRQLEHERALRASLKAGNVGLHAGCMKGFESFRAQAMQRPRRALKEAAVKAYEGIWVEWLMYLIVQGIGWRAATPDDVAGFLKSGLRARNFVRNSEAKVSPVTQARYARVLAEIYSAALGEDERHLSPVKLVGKEVPQSEAMPSMKLHAHLREQLRRKMPKAEDEKSARDRLVICLTLLEGMTCSDIMGMSLGDLLFKEGDERDLKFGSQHASVDEMNAWQRGFTSEQGGGGMLLAPEVAPRGAHLRGERKAQDRRVAFTRTTRQSLQDWLGFRAQNSGGQATNKVVLSLSRRRGEDGPGATHRTLFGVCSEHIDRALDGSNLMTAQEVMRLQHIGPNTLRNACLLEWMAEGVDVEEVRRRSGLKETRSLARLAEENREQDSEVEA